ncbi:MAG: hypothetical protein OXU81_17085, partial [Gammaproteobacteria bacterium]|nr:hypothetical protein [Gammaproteobacteria bacterium]
APGRGRSCFAAARAGLARWPVEVASRADGANAMAAPRSAGRQEHPRCPGAAPAPRRAPPLAIAGKGAGAGSATPPLPVNADGGLLHDITAATVPNRVVRLPPLTVRPVPRALVQRGTPREEPRTLTTLDPAVAARTR